jgi:hypothetical protein
MAPPKIVVERLKELAEVIHKKPAAIQAVIAANNGILQCEPPRDSLFASEKNLTWLHIAFWEADYENFAALLAEYEKPENRAPNLIDTLTSSAGVRSIEIYQLPKLALLQPSASQSPTLPKDLNGKVGLILDKLFEAEKVPTTKDKATKALKAMAQDALSLLNTSNPQPAYFNTLCDEFAKQNKTEELIAWLNASGPYKCLQNDKVLSSLSNDALMVALRLNIRPVLTVIPLIEYAMQQIIIPDTINRLPKLSLEQKSVIFKNIKLDDAITVMPDWQIFYTK